MPATRRPRRLWAARASANRSRIISCSNAANADITFSTNVSAALPVNSG